MLLVVLFRSSLSLLIFCLVLLAKSRVGSSKYNCGFVCFSFQRFLLHVFGSSLCFSGGLISWNLPGIILGCTVSVPPDNNTIPSVVTLLQLQILTQMSTFQSGLCWLLYLKLQPLSPNSSSSNPLSCSIFLPCPYNIVIDSKISLLMMLNIYW